jgi:uncharacterized protein YkwD/LysM repeat protein
MVSEKCSFTFLQSLCIFKGNICHVEWKPCPLFDQKQRKGYSMLKKILLSMSILLAVISPTISVQAQSRANEPLPRQPAEIVVYALIDEINALRVATGKSPYEVSPILMSTAQSQAEYMASIQTTTHLGPDGSTASERLLAAGYPLAGNLSLGGIRSEAIVSGPGMTVTEAVEVWKGDDIHYNTMTSPNYTQIGAGMATSGEDVYYVIDCARNIGSLAPYLTNTPEPTSELDTSEQSVAPADSGYVVLPGEGPLATSLFTATPGADGKQYHVVQPGETLWLIAISYGVKIADIRHLNNMSETEAVYPKEKLLIREGIVVTPVPPTPSNTPVATLFVRPTQTLPYPSPTATPVAATPSTPSSTFLGVGALVMVVLIIIGMTLGFGQTDDNRRAGW